MTDKSTLIATLLTTLGVLFMMAMAFGIMPANIAIFAGVACFILAGTMKRIMRPDKD